MCCFVLDGSPHSYHHALWEKRSYLAAHTENVIFHRDNAPYRTTRNTCLDELWFQRARMYTFFSIISARYKMFNSKIPYILNCIMKQICTRHRLDKCG